jgi:hypothetical protein
MTGGADTKDQPAPRAKLTLPLRSQRFAQVHLQTLRPQRQVSLSALNETSLSRFHLAEAGNIRAHPNSSYVYGVSCRVRAKSYP